MKNFKRKFAVLIFSLCLVASLVFYYNKNYNTLGYILLVFENTIKTFLGNSPLKLADIVDLKFSDKNIVNQFFILIYALIIYIAPIFLAAAIVSEFNNFKIKIYKFIFNIKIKYSKDDIIVFGYNDLVKVFLENKIEDGEKRKVIVVSNERISDEEIIKYLKNNISFINTSLSDNSKEEKNNIYRLMDNIENIYLFELDNLINYSYLIEICNHYENKTEYNGNAKKIYCYAEDYQANVMISKYIHSRLESKNENNVKLNKVISDYNVFDISSLRIRKLLSDDSVKIVSNYKKPNTHSIIVGFGNLGHTVFNEILNKSVYNQNGKIRIDIISNDIDKEKNYILNRTSGYYFKAADRTQNHLEISNDANNNDFRCDGKLDVYFHKDSIEDKSFYRKVKEILEESDGGVDNIFICTSVVSTTIRAMNSLQDLHIKNEELFNNSINVFIRIENNNIFSNNNYNNDKYFKYILIPSAKDVLNTKSIENKEETNKAIAYNYIYNQLCDSIYKITNDDNKNNSFIELHKIKGIKNEFENNNINIKDKDIKFSDNKNAQSVINKAKSDWQKLDYARRESTWGLVLHQSVKDDLLKNVYNIDEVKKDLNKVCNMSFNDLSSLVKYLNESSNTQMFDFIKIEHRRWCYMKALEGFHYVEHGDKKKHQHECLLTYDKLAERVPKSVLYDLIPLIYEFC